jgi:NAD(P)-dependent dehydrogenase (short-subunit alcohol dehydrogenase family)
LSFAGKQYLVTGAASGIGKAVAEMLRAQGATVWRMDRLPEAELCIDIGEEAEWVEAVSRFERIDGIVHAAGISAGSPIIETPAEEWRRVMRVNLDGSFFALKRGLPKVVDGGSVVLLGSASGRKASPGAAAYCASKAAVAMLAKVAALEAKARKIRVNLVSPAGVVTPMWKTMAFFNDLVEKTGSEMGAYAVLGGAEPEKHPLERMAFAGEIAEAVLFLLGDGSRGVTGHELRVDAGYTL